MVRASAKVESQSQAPKGVVANGAPGKRGEVEPEQLLRMYRGMLRIRTVDERMMTLQRQGRIGFYGACTGQEAACIGSAMALEPSDWIFPALREGAAMLLRGYPLVPYLAQVFGNSADETKGRQMPSHQASRRVNQVSWGSCIGTQLTHAVGAAWAAKLKGEPRVMLAYLGDGATSSADFHTAMNFAGVNRVPVVFVCQNNHWSISESTQQQTASETLAIKASAYGFPGVKIDGNSAQVVYATTREAVERARSGGGPTFIEAETYRIGAHSSSDDPSRYRDPAEVEIWKARDPIDALQRKLLADHLLTPAADESLRSELLSEVNAAITEVERLPLPEVMSLFDDVYAELPWHLREERDALATELSGRPRKADLET
jgi:pyruvate dehydrogenase E1 component alpha subunit/2-oxoisovalerate dehydrogenase E1 component alpha subunit